MRRFVMAIALACALSSTAFAGIIHSTDEAAPAPQASSSAVTTTIILTILSLVR